MTVYCKNKVVVESDHLVGFLSLHYLAARFNTMYYKEGWFFPMTTIIIFGMYLYIYMLDKLYGPREVT
jgi:hypothetical protein